ncbi:MAG: glycogen debranching protein GlgX, partial [Candidatus Binatia bacterium]
CQDNEISWVDWDLDPRQQQMLQFVRQVFAIRRATPVLRRRSFFGGRAVDSSKVKDLAWLRPDGGEMNEGDWADGERRAIGMLMYAGATDEVDDRGRAVTGDTLLWLLNASSKSVTFAMPKLPEPGTWHELVDTARAAPRPVRGESVAVTAHSSVLLRYGAPA